MTGNYKLTTGDWSVNDVMDINNQYTRLSLPEDIKNRIQNCRDYLESRLADGNELLYGINTGFGSLCNHAIAPDDISEHQSRLIRSHSAGMGNRIDDNLVGLIMLLKIKSFCYGHSGVRVELVERLIEFYNLQAFPIIYEHGSLGASGDLAPLAHLSLALIGEGKIRWMGKTMSSAKFHKKNDLKPLSLASKEGLALINGTQFTTALALSSLYYSEILLDRSVAIAALSAEAFQCHVSPFHPDVHQIRRQEGQIAVAAKMKALMRTDPREHYYSVQDPYSFRCIPQVLGASKDGLAFAKTILTKEINSVTDNPLIFPESGEIISGGNFHAEPVAQVCETIAVAITEVMNISERRSFLLLSGFRDLPEHLSPDPGKNSGYMIAQYTAAAILARSKMLCHPVTVDSITSCKGQEDHVSFGATAALRNLELVDNAADVIAIECLLACQAMDFRPKSPLSAELKELHETFRTEVKHLEQDRPIYKDMRASFNFLLNKFSEMQKILPLACICFCLLLVSCKTTSEIVEPAPEIDTELVELQEELSQKWISLIKQDHITYPLLTWNTTSGLHSHVESVQKKNTNSKGQTSSVTLHFVADDKVQHAWQLPSGDVYLTTGLMKALETDDQLAAVLFLLQSGVDQDVHWNKIVKAYGLERLRLCCNEEEDNGREIMESYVWNGLESISQSAIDTAQSRLCGEYNLEGWSKMVSLQNKLSTPFSVNWAMNNSMSRIDENCPILNRTDLYKYAKSYLSQQNQQLENGPNGLLRDPTKMDGSRGVRIEKEGGQ